MLLYQNKLEKIAIVSVHNKSRYLQPVIGRFEVGRFL